MKKIIIGTAILPLLMLSCSNEPAIKPGYYINNICKNWHKGGPYFETTGLEVLERDGKNYVIEYAIQCQENAEGKFVPSNFDSDPNYTNYPQFSKVQTEGKYFTYKGNLKEFKYKYSKENNQIFAVITTEDHSEIKEIIEMLQEYSDKDFDKAVEGEMNISGKEYKAYLTQMISPEGFTAYDRVEKSQTTLKEAFVEGRKFFQEGQIKKIKGNK